MCNDDSESRMGGMSSTKSVASDSTGFYYKNKDGTHINKPKIRGRKKSKQKRRHSFGSSAGGSGWKCTKSSFIVDKK